MRRDSYTIDHIISRRHSPDRFDGANGTENLVGACHACNQHRNNFESWFESCNIHLKLKRPRPEELRLRRLTGIEIPSKTFHLSQKKLLAREKSLPLTPSCALY